MTPWETIRKIDRHLERVTRNAERVEAWSAGSRLISLISLIPAGLIGALLAALHAPRIVFAVVLIPTLIGCVVWNVWSQRRFYKQQLEKYGMDRPDRP